MTTNIYPVDKVKYISSLAEIPKTGKVIIDFFADWCGPCKKLAPSYSELSTQYTNITFLKVNTDKAEEVAQFYEISALLAIIVAQKFRTIIRSHQPRICRIKVQ